MRMWSRLRGHSREVLLRFCSRDLLTNFLRNLLGNLLRGFRFFGRGWALASWTSVLLAAADPGAAHAGRTDLNLLNLCPLHTPPAGTLGAQVPECSWVNRQPGTGLIQGVVFDAEAETRFRSLMSELGAAIAPRLVVPADTLGFSGFQVAAEMGMTSISHTAGFWQGVAGVSAENPAATRPDAYLSTVGMFVRKGIWLPLPAMEAGAGVLNIVNSQMFVFQGYAKLGLHEGFHDWPLPSVAARVGGSHLTGTSQARLDVFSFDGIASKAFGVGGTARVEIFGGASYLVIKARSGVIDATPSCDAFALANAAPGAPISPYCAPSQRGTANDLRANFTFPNQDAITRYRLFGGAKLKVAWFFVAGQYEIIPRGASRDEQHLDGARDTSAQQYTVSLSGGVDF